LFTEEERQDRDRRVEDTTRRLNEAAEREARYRQYVYLIVRETYSALNMNERKKVF
jgi:hypothetical protein